MGCIAKRVSIAASAEVIFHVITDPSQFSLLNPNFTVKSHQRSPLGGPEFQFDYKIAGITLSGNTQIREYRQPVRLVSHTHGGLVSQWEWTLNPLHGETEVMLQVNYEIPGGVIGMMLGRLGLDQYNNQLMNELLINLKRMSENSC
jgi:hypothetical protein